MQNISPMIDSKKASRVALGIMRLANLNVEQAIEVLVTAFKSGINVIDSADIYGRGKSETILGQALPFALKHANMTREDIIIQSKAGIHLELRADGQYDKYYDFDKDYLITAVEGVLKRLNIAYLDVFLLHRPDTLMDLNQVSDAFIELYERGLVRHFGVSNFNVMQMKMLQKAVNFKLEYNQLQFGLKHTSMINSGLHTNMEIESALSYEGGILEYCRLKNVTIQAWSPFQHGHFAGVFIDNPLFPELNAALEVLTTKYKVGKNAIATAWILTHPAKMQVVIGTLNQERIKDCALGESIKLTKKEWYELYFAAGNTLP